MIVLRALGTAEIETGLTTLTPSQEIVFAAALYIVLERGKRLSRERLAALLWPRVTDRLRAHRLRQTIFQLKKFGFVVRASREAILLLKDEAETDVDGLVADGGESFTESRAFDFLPGYSPGFSEPLQDWTDAKRAEVHGHLTRILVHKLEEARLRANWPLLERIASQVLTLDEFNEAAVLGLAEASAMRGGKRMAVSILDRYLAEVEGGPSDLKLPASLLRRRIVERIPDRQALLNPDPPFVGREAEMRELTRSLYQARAGHGSATLLIGEPGIGKSRLSAEIARFAELQGIRVQHAVCRQTDLDRPLSVFVDLASQLRELPGALGCAPETFSALKRLTEFELRSNESPRWGDASSLFEAIREALFDLFDSVADERCLLTIVDDVQWLDGASRRILSLMIQWAATKPVLFVLNSRPGSAPLSENADDSQLKIIELGPLSAAASCCLLRSLDSRPGEQADSDFASWCLSVADGNPFFLQELAHHWVENGHRYEAPPSVTRVLQGRLSRLSKDALQLLQTCAVLAEHGTLERVERILEYSSHQLITAVEDLSEAAMLDARQGGPEPTVQYIRPRHDLLASAAVARLSPISLAFIHRKSAEVLEKELDDEKMPTKLLWACANHRHQAGDRARALSLGLACAQHLLEVGLPEESCTRYEDSLAYCSSNEDRLALLPRFATALQVKGEWERSKQILRTCVKLNSQMTGASTHSEFEILLFQAQHRSCLDYVTLLDEIIPCVESTQASPRHRVSAAAIALKLAADVGPSEKLDAIYFQIKPFLSLETIDPVVRQETEIIYQTMRGEREIPIEFLESFTQSARSLHGEIGYSHALVAAAAACRISGRDQACLRFIDEAFDHAVSHRLRSRIPVIVLTKVRLYVAAEDFTAARKTLSEGDDFPIPNEDQVTRAEWQFFDARVSLEDRPLPDIEKAVSAIEIVPETYSVNRRAACLAAVLRLRLMQTASSVLIRPIVEDLEAAHRINRDIGLQDFETHSLFLGLRALGDEMRGRQLVGDYVNHYRRSRRPLSSSIQDLVSDGYELNAGISGRGAAEHQLAEPIYPP